MRRPIIAGNWKMNKALSEAKVLVEALKPLVADAEAEVVVCPTYVNLMAVKELLAGSNIKLGAQNCHFEKSGAYTGEISVDMLKEIGVEFVIIGHSERREYYAETDEGVNKKAKAILAAGMTPIVCCGETLEQRESGVTDTFVSGQIKAALDGLTGEQVASLVIAYEPIWAIGTGKTATSEQANETIAMIRKTVAGQFDQATADAVRIQYGGSMKPANAAELMAQPDIDGGLIGGASLVAEDFSKVVKY
ncbi:MAG: triose-phosphate isomerase [Eubacteriales bacterium]